MAAPISYMTGRAGGRNEEGTQPSAWRKDLGEFGIPARVSGQLGLAQSIYWTLEGRSRVDDAREEWITAARGQRDQSQAESAALWDAKKDF